MKIHNPFDYTNKVIDTETLTGPEKLVALVIARHFNWVDLDPAFPSNELLAKETQYNVRTVIRAKNALVEKGWLVSERRFNKSNFYTPAIPNSDTLSPQGDVGDTMSLGGWHNVMSRGDTEYKLTNNRTNNIKDNNNPEEIQESKENSLGLISNNIDKEYKEYKDSLGEKLMNNKITEDTYLRLLKEKKLSLGL